MPHNSSAPGSKRRVGVQTGIDLKHDLVSVIEPGHTDGVAQLQPVAEFFGDVIRIASGLGADLAKQHSQASVKIFAQDDASAHHEIRYLVDAFAAGDLRRGVLQRLGHFVFAAETGLKAKLFLADVDAAVQSLEIHFFDGISAATAVMARVRVDTNILLTLVSAWTD